jgi:peptidoglycan/LPS O-acetylase OafA/YrhL
VVIGDKVEPEGRVQLWGNDAGTAPEDRTFRPDVQGMRAIAILLALVYHADIPGFSGGYVGIEVFFVISGFVITGLLLRERASTGSTSILNFYGRRVRRILPAATLVIIITVIASYIVLGPLTGDRTSIDARWASVFLINIHFQSIGTNYLSSQLPPSVLQNYWSLAVEEQFYIVYPTLFLLIGWWARKGSFRARLTVVLVAVIVASYGYSIALTLTDAPSAYFSLLTRAWELALGGLLAVHVRRFQHIPQAWAAVASWVGLIVILVASVTLTGSSMYPGALVAIPTLGAGLVIAAGTAQPTWGVERMLRRKSFQFLAAISFPLYLWHWPILEIAAQSRGVTLLPAWDDILLLLMAGGLATLTYYYFENPIRHSKALVSKRGASLAFGVCLIASSLTVATVALQLHPTPALATPSLAALPTAADCPYTPPRPATGPSATSDHKIVARVLLIGDSSACTMFPGLQAVAATAGVQIEDAAVVGCGIVSGQLAPDVVDGRNIVAGTRLCQSRATRAVARAQRSGAPNVVLWASSWERASFVEGHGADEKVLPAGSAQWYSVLEARMRERVRQLTATGATVVMVTQPPFAEGGVTTEPTAQDHEFERLNTLLTQFAARAPHVKVVDLASYVCPSGPPCPILVDNLWVRGDGAHYTLDGSVWVARWLLPQLGISALDKAVTPLPTMKVFGPPNGAVLKGTHELIAQPAYQTGLAKVEFEVNGPALREETIGTCVKTPDGFWVLYWNTHAVPNGTYVIRGVAFNAAGDRRVSKGVTVKVAN